MKLQATITVSFQAGSLADAGAKLDDVLARARKRDDIDVEAVDVHTPVGAGPVSLPHVAAPGSHPATVPHPGNGR